jgi:uncharacterized RDD family membrane protein YckC
MTTVFSKRVIAYVLDFIALSAFMWIVSYFIYALMGSKNVYSVYQFLPFIVPVLILIYFVIFEKLAGASIGKAIMNIQVKSKNGSDISWPQAIVRNITKIYWFPIIFDWLIGKFLHSDRLFNKITQTIVVNDI